MTIQEAIEARIQPYTLPKDTIEVICLDCGIDDMEEDYDAETYKTAVTQAVIAALGQLTTITREQDHGSTQTYDPEQLKTRISALKRELGEEDQANPKNVDITDWW